MSDAFDREYDAFLDELYDAEQASLECYAEMAVEEAEQAHGIQLSGREHKAVVSELMDGAELVRLDVPEEWDEVDEMGGREQPRFTEDPLLVVARQYQRRVFAAKQGPLSAGVCLRRSGVRRVGAGRPRRARHRQRARAPSTRGTGDADPERRPVAPTTHGGGR